MHDIILFHEHALHVEILLELSNDAGEIVVIARLDNEQAAMDQTRMNDDS